MYVLVISDQSIFQFLLIYTKLDEQWTCSFKYNSETGRLTGSGKVPVNRLTALRVYTRSTSYLFTRSMT